MAQLNINVLNSDNILEELENLITSDIFGCGVELYNMEYLGNPQAIGEFSYVQNNDLCEGGFGLDRGILMTTGMINYASGPNNNSDSGQEWNVEYEDSFLHDYLVDSELITPSVDLFDACVLEFDITSSDTLSMDFEIIFGSEEYTEWMNPFYADVFAFFVTEIDGDTDPNFDLIPKNIMETGNILNLDSSCDIENKPISAWTIRPYSNVFGSPGMNECLYLDNENGEFCDAIGYDGYTESMLFNLSILPSATYHIKMVIIDAVSDSWPGLDSGVFIKNTGLSSSLNANIFPDFTYSILDNTVTFVPNTFDNSASNTYLWDFNDDGEIDSNEINPMYSFDTDGTYIITVTIINNCTGETNYQEYEISINTISDLTDILDSSISIFPNPASEKINIFGTDFNSESVIQIFDLSGRMVYEEIVDQSFHTVDVNNLLSGVYFISVINESTSSDYLKKLIIF